MPDVERTADFKVDALGLLEQRRNRNLDNARPMTEPSIIDYSHYTATWHAKVNAIQQALRDKRYATALAKIADMQASLIAVDAWVQGEMD